MVFWVFESSPQIQVYFCESRHIPPIFPHRPILHCVSPSLPASHTQRPPRRPRNRRTSPTMPASLPAPQWLTHISQSHQDRREQITQNKPVAILQFEISTAKPLPAGPGTISIQQPNDILFWKRKKMEKRRRTTWPAATKIVLANSASSPMRLDSTWNAASPNWDVLQL